MSTKPSKTVQENHADATEFQRRRNMPHVQVRHMSAGRTFDVVLSIQGIEIGSRCDLLKRGNVVSRTYVLPSLDRLNALLALPVATTRTP